MLIYTYTHFKLLYLFISWQSRQNMSYYLHKGAKTHTSRLAQTSQVTMFTNMCVSTTFTLHFYILSLFSSLIVNKKSLIRCYNICILILFLLVLGSDFGIYTKIIINLVIDHCFVHMHVVNL